MLLLKSAHQLDVDGAEVDEAVHALGPQLGGDLAQRRAHGLERGRHQLGGQPLVHHQVLGGARARVAGTIQLPCDGGSSFFFSSYCWYWGYNGKLRSIQGGLCYDAV